MKLSIYFLLLVTFLMSCNQKSSMQQEFDCSSSIDLLGLEKVNDFNKNFSIKVPNRWTKQLYYNNFESKIMVADSTKSLTKSYIFETSLIQGNLIIDKGFTDKKTNELIAQNQFSSIDFKEGKFKEMPCVWFSAEGKKNNFKYLLFQVYAKKNEKEYLEFTTKIFGTDEMTERLCESFHLMNSIQY